MNEVEYVKDEVLKKRWKCSGMKLWRMRKAGVFAVYPAGRVVAPKTRALVEFLRTRYVGSRVSLA